MSEYCRDCTHWHALPAQRGVADLSVREPGQCKESRHLFAVPTNQGMALQASFLPVTGDSEACGRFKKGLRVLTNGQTPPYPDMPIAEG